jgi:uncharacterized membrane protein
MKKEKEYVELTPEEDLEANRTLLEQSKETLDERYEKVKGLYYSTIISMIMFIILIININSSVSSITFCIVSFVGSIVLFLFYREECKSILWDKYCINMCKSELERLNSEIYRR